MEQLKIGLYLIKNQQKNYTKQLLENLEKKQTKVHLSFINNVWGADLADIKLISKFNIEFRFLLCVVDTYSKYIWVVPLKNKKGITINNAFQKVLNESNHKSNQIWVDKGSEFYNRLIKSFLQNSYIQM